MLGPCTALRFNDFLVIGICEDAGFAEADEVGICRDVDFAEVSLEGRRPRSRKEFVISIQLEEGNQVHTFDVFRDGL